MKRILSTLTLLLCFAFTAVNAQVITAERAAEIANSFFSAGVQKSAAARGVVSSPSLTSSFDSNDVTETASAEPTFYVLTNPEGGFVIVSGEETENPIVGYSLDGTIDVNNLPDGFVDYMTDIDAQVKALREYNTNNPQKAAAARSAMQRAASYEHNATTMGNIKVLLETAKWGQGSPFNTLCFTDATHTTNAKTGCVPTAFAIVMRYHKWPEEGIGKLVDFQLSTASEYIYITDRTYDWDNMPLVYDGNCTEYQKNEVAKVMRDLGQAYMVDYGKNETGVSVPGSSGKLETYFNYNNVSGVSQAEAGSIDNWKTRIKESLDNNCPIPYKSHNNAPGSDANHMFVLDGYTDNDYYHFNWGWSGSGNGWYQLTLMNPSGSDYSWGASSDQLAIFNLTPKKTKRTVTASVSPTGAGTVTVNGSANSAEVIEGTTATLDATANDGYTFSYWSKGGVQVSTEKTYKAPVAAEGNVYVANFLTVSSTRVNVSVSYNSSYGTVTQKNGSTISGTGLTPYQNSEVTLVATPLDGYVFNGWTVTKGTNSTNYSGTELTFVATENMSVEARFSLAVSDYTISTSNITKSDYRQGSSSYCSTWTTADGIILSATKGSEKAYALSASNPLLYARATTESSTETAVNEITFTLTAPDGYILLSYDIFCYCNGSYTIDATPEGGNTITINRADDHTISASGINAKSARFVLSSSNGNAAIRFDSFTVRLQSEGGGSTPTPDPTPTTYTIYATAGEGGSVTINGDAVSQKSVNENSTVTLVATPQTGYRFVNWTDANNGSEVSTSATYSYTATSNKSLVANFEQTQYTVTVAAGEGGVAYIGTKGTTSTTANYNDNLTITAEANDGYEFVEWRAFDSHFTSNAQQDVTVTADVTYTAVFRSTTQQPATNLAGKYFRLKTTVDSAVKYMNVGTESENSHGNVNMVDLKETSDDQIFLFEQSGDGYKLKAKSGNYINCAEWNVYANTTNANEASVLLFEKSGDGYLINWYNTFKSAIKYFNVQTANAGDKALHPYSDGDKDGAAVWVLEEVVYYTVTATAGEGGRVSPQTSTVEKGKPVTLTATANSGYRFVNWTKGGVEVSTDASYTFNATAAGEYVANFEISTYTISATANPGTAGSVTINGEAVSSKNVNENSTVTLVATPQAGYCFVNWTKGETVVSTDATYSFTATEITSLVANFEQIVVTATLTDAQGNKYIVKLSGFTNGVTKETVAAKLSEAYPYITLGTTDQEGNVIDFGVLNIDGTAYTYTNRVELPFKVSNATYIWHNIYYPANSNDNPNYIAALNEDEVVDMAASKDYAYGDNPTYNTKDGGNSICWAIYNVNNSFEFIFKSRVTNKYIKVESVSSSTTQNVKFVENAKDATAFTLLAKETVDLTGVYPAVTGDCDFALVANIDETTGYLCATSSDEDYVTHFDRYNHRGAWVKIVEAPDYFSKIMDMGTMLGYRFGAGDSKCVIAGTNIEEVDNAMQNSGSITLNKLNDYAARMEAAMATEDPTWFNVKTSAENGAAYITLENDDPELTSKRVPGGYELTVKATPATGYHFTGWTMNGTAIEGATEEHTFTVTEATTIVASFAINTYTVDVTAGENGSVTVTHDENGETVDINGKTIDFATVIKIEATPNDGYKFIGWYNGEELQHNINPHKFAINHDIYYTARFEEEEAGSTTNKYVIKIDAILTDGETAANNATGNVQAIINGIGLDWATSAEVVENAIVELVAISDHNQSGYLFEGWYKNGELVNTALSYEVAVTEKVTYEARFVKGKVIKLTSNNNSLCRPNMPTYTDGSEVAGTITDLRAVVKDGEELFISIDDNVIANFTGEGYRVANWTDKDGNKVAGKNVYSFTIKVNGDNTYKVNLEKDTYTLTVSTEGTMGTVHIGDGTETSVTVNNGETAKITATPKSGCKFVNWTLNGVVVSTENPYNVPAITDNVQYVAVFAEADALDAGYYRIAYDFPVAAAAAKSAATRAVGDTYSINNNTGVLNNSKSSKYTEWIDNTIDATELSLRATNSDGTPVHAIKKATGDYYYQFNAYTCDNSNTYSTSTKYTLSVSGNYIIKECSITYKQSVAGQVTISYGDKSDAFNNTSDNTLSLSPNAQTVEFTLTSSARSTNYYLHIRNFTVTIQPVGGESEGGGETPEPEPEPDTETVRYYIQSKPVSGTNNAMVMEMETEENYASSIFYYDGVKLLSYQKGTYIKEDGGTRGLQAVGAYGETRIKEVDTNDEDEKICTVAAPSYMHAVINQSGTSYVDNCGSNEDTNAHANHKFVLEEVTSLPVTITEAGYATWYAPVAVQLPEEEDLTAYTITIQGDYAVTGDGFKTVPAKTGVILAGTPGTYDLAITTTTDKVESILKGTVAAEILPNGSAYVLSNKGTIGLAFYMAQEGAASWSHKAYLPKSAIPADAQMSAGFRLILPGTTAIEEVETENNIDAIYDLTGRKLEGISGTGIYIINGKKVIVR